MVATVAISNGSELTGNRVPAIHPITDSQVSFNSPVPSDMSASVELSPLSPNAHSLAEIHAADKAKLREQSAQIEKWLESEGKNLYPSREEKEKLASQLNMTYLQINRWFANKRRKGSKKVKSSLSNNRQPVLKDPNGSSGDNSSARIDTEMLTSLAAALSQQKASEASKQSLNLAVKKEMDNNRQSTPPAIHDPVSAQMLNHLTALSNADLAKALLQQSSNPQLLLAALCSQPVYQNNVNLQQLLFQLQWQQLAATSLASSPQMPPPMQTHQIPHATLPAQTLPSWMSPPVSASPLAPSEGGVSDLSAISPRPASPPFKDPQHLADPHLSRILNQHPALTEKEHIAVAVLAGLCMQRT